MNGGNPPAVPNNNVVQQGNIEAGLAFVGPKHRFEAKLATFAYDIKKKVYLEDLLTKSTNIGTDLSLLMPIDMPVFDHLLAEGGKLHDFQEFCNTLRNVNEEVTRANLLETVWNTNEVVSTKL